MCSSVPNMAPRSAAPAPAPVPAPAPPRYARLLLLLLLLLLAKNDDRPAKLLLLRRGAAATPGVLVKMLPFLLLPLALLTKLLVPEVGVRRGVTLLIREPTDRRRPPEAPRPPLLLLLLVIEVSDRFDISDRFNSSCFRLNLQRCGKGETTPHTQNSVSA